MKTRKIEILPANLANMIAAGEVVQNPASVVKEMLENSIDAGASAVTVMITDAGRTLIRVIDDGCGMSYDDAVKCFERHATSKVSTPEDLQAIITYGFRGEALASIAAVSEVTLRTRRAGDDVGTEILYADSKFVSSQEVSCPEGSDFSVRNLFYNVPARRKFLKSDASEFRKIVAEFTRVALTRPEISLKLIHNGKDVFNLKKSSNLKMRIVELVGKEISKEIVDARADTSLVKISGYIGKPEGARKTSGNQYFFVNGRFFKSPYLHKAVMKAYENLIPQGTVPSYFLYLEVSPESVDVNIHPTKTEVKFEDESVIFQIVNACVKESLGKNSFVPSIDFDTEGAPEIPYINPNEISEAVQPSVSVDPTYNPFDSDGYDNEKDFFQIQAPVRSTVSGQRYDTGFSSYHESGINRFQAERQPVQDFGKLFEDDKVCRQEDLLVSGGKYIIQKNRNGFRIFNILRARERVFYNRLIQSVAMGEIISEQTLFPIQLEIGVHATSLIGEYQDVLNTIGFDIRPSGDSSVVVYGQPSGYSSDKSAVFDTLSELICSLDESAGELRSEMITNMAVKLSHISALTAGGDFTSSEARALIEQLEGCEDSQYSPYSGKYCYKDLSFEDIDKLFA